MDSKAWLPFLTALLGGMGVAVFNKLIDFIATQHQKAEDRLRRRDDSNAQIENKRIDDNTLIRGELRTRVNDLEKRNFDLETKYFEKESAYNKLQNEFDEYKVKHP